jgi:5-methyltetrahydrofolate--homocysteine methyltransferase
MATMTFEQTRRGFYTVMGVSIPAAARGLQAAGADIIGSNCGFGIDTMIEVARQFRQHARVPIAIQANAGLPVTRNGVTVYPETPGHVAVRAPELLAAGVQIIGGCCGTTPAHIRALRALVR